MKMKNLGWLNAIVFGCAMLMFTGCDLDSDEPAGTGEVEFEITDAPSDDASVKGVFVTVAEVKIDGQSVSGFTKQTIDLKAYQDGNTKLLGKTQTTARTYGNMTLVLDLDADADGNSPGCYVLTQSNDKFKLKSTASGKTEIVVNKSWSVAKDAKTRLIADVDLRKAIKYSDDPSVRYMFVSDNNLNTSVRLVTKDKSGTIKGEYDEELLVDADKIVVYAYKKGTFNAATEMQAQGDDGIFFANAVASAQIKQGLAGKEYTLAFLEEGEYELHFARYNENSENGRLTFESLLQAETSIGGSVGSIITVQGNASISISTVIKGLI